jgi:hypothetical protein
LKTKHAKSFCVKNTNSKGVVPQNEDIIKQYIKDVFKPSIYKPPAPCQGESLKNKVIETALVRTSSGLRLFHFVCNLSLFKGFSGNL